MIYICFFVFFLNNLNTKNVFTLGSMTNIFFLIYYIIPIQNHDILSLNLLYTNGHDYTIDHFIIYANYFAFNILYGLSMRIRSEKNYILVCEMRNEKILPVFTLTLVLMYLLGYASVGAFSNIGNYGSTSYASQSTSFLIQLNIWLVVVSSIAVTMNPGRLKNLIFVMILVASALTFAIGVRSIAITIILPWARLFMNNIRLTTQYTILTLGVIFLMVIQNLRSFKRIGLQNAIDRLTEKFNGDSIFLIFYEQTEPFLIFSRIRQDFAFADLKFGYSIVESLILVLPSPIRNFIGLTDNCNFLCPSEWFMQHIGLYWEHGNLAFSLLAELYLNFGNMGFLFILILGIVFGKFDRAVEHGNNAMLKHIGLILTPMTLGLMRNDLSMTIKFLIYALILYVITCAIFVRFKARVPSRKIT